jgi:hypothetical protein
VELGEDRIERAHQQWRERDWQRYSCFRCISIMASYKAKIQNLRLTAYVHRYTHAPSPTVGLTSLCSVLHGYCIMGLPSRDFYATVWAIETMEGRTCSQAHVSHPQQIIQLSSLGIDARNISIPLSDHAYASIGISQVPDRFMHPLVHSFTSYMCCAWYRRVLSTLTRHITFLDTKTHH